MQWLPRSELWRFALPCVWLVRAPPSVLPAWALRRSLSNCQAPCMPLVGVLASWTPVIRSTPILVPHRRFFLRHRLRREALECQSALAVTLPAEAQISDLGIRRAPLRFYAAPLHQAHGRTAPGARQRNLYPALPRVLRRRRDVRRVRLPGWNCAERSAP